MQPVTSAETIAFLDAVRSDYTTLPDPQISPIHVLFPDAIAANVARFREVYRRHALEPHIYYALKANKSAALLKSAWRQTDHVEVSSRYELLQALAAGYTGPDMLASGPIKSPSYLQLCITHSVVIAIDDPTELDAVLTLCKQSDTLAAVLLRVNYPGSRFGVFADDIHSILANKTAYQQHITIKGFSFHINNYSVEDRQTRLTAAINLVKLARKHGHKACSAISIGGGFTVNYVTANAWRNWQDSYAKGQINTYDHKDLSSVYPYHSAHAKEQFLDAILSGTSGSATLAQLLRDNNIDLIIEPGRSLLDQAGISIFSINGVKQHISNYPMVLVEGNINSLSEQWFGSDFLLDPFLLPRARHSGRKKTPVHCYIGGNLCLENDMLATRPVPFDQLPERGDQLVYVNTAGYQMDSNESEFARLPIPQKFIATKHKDTWRLLPDEK